MHRTLYRWLASLMILSMFLSSAAPAAVQAAASPTVNSTTVLSEDLESGTLPAGWTVSGDPGWTFNNPGGRTNGAGSTGKFAIADSDKAGSVVMNTALMTPVLDLSAYSTATLKFKTYFKKWGSEVADVDVSTDGGTTWTNKWKKTGANFTGAVSIDLPIVASVKVRFNFTKASFAWYWQVDEVRVEVSSSAGLPPSAPTSLAIVSIAVNQVALRWTDNSSGETGFKLEGSADGSTGWTQIGLFNLNAVTGEDGTILYASTRYYRVRSVNASGASTPSNVVSAATTACIAAGPSAPSGLEASASSSKVYLFWAYAGNIDGYKVQWSSNGASDWTALSQVSSFKTSEEDSTIPCGTTRFYRVIAYKDNVDSAPSATVSAGTAACPAPPPTAPSGLTAVLSGSSINLTWTDTSTTETGFKVERSTNAGSTWSQIVLTTANTTSYADSGLTCGTRYAYRVRAANANGDSADSPAAESMSATCPPPVPTAPSSLTAVLSGININLTWTDTSTTETGFKVERSANAGGAWSQITVTAANSNSYSDSGLTCGTTYTYRVRASNDSGDSAYSPTASASAAVCPPAAPSGLTAVLNGSSINLSWTDNSATETGFKVERSANAGGAWSQIVLTTANTVSYIDSSLACGALFTYRVRATNASGDSAYSATASASTAACPPNPTATPTPTSTPIPPATPTPTPTSTPIPPSYPRQTSLSESFTSNSLPAGWTLIPASGAAAWAFNDPGARTNKTGGTGGFAIIDSDKAGRVDVTAELRTPPMDLSAHTVVKLIYRQSFSAYSNSTADVDYSIDGGGTWTNISTKTGASASGEVMALVPGAVGQSSVVFRFRYYNANYAWYWQLDDVRVPGAIEAGAPLEPSAVTATLNGADATLSWTDNSPNETNFVIGRSTDGGTSWVEAGRTAPNIATFTDKNLACGSTFTYRAKALVGALSSAYSSPVSVTTPVCPLRLTSLNEDFNTSTQTTLPAGWFVEGGLQSCFSSASNCQNITGGTGFAPFIYTAISLRSPILDLGSLPAVQLTFKIYFFSPNDPGRHCRYQQRWGDHLDQGLGFQYTFHRSGRSGYHLRGGRPGQYHAPLYFRQ